MGYHRALLLGVAALSSSVTYAQSGFTIGKTVARFQIEVPSGNPSRLNYQVNIPVPDDFEDNALTSLGVYDLKDRVNRVSQVDILTRGSTGKAEIVRISGDIGIPGGKVAGDFLTVHVKRIYFNSASDRDALTRTISFPAIATRLSQKPIYVAIRDAWGYYYVSKIHRKNFKMLHEGPSMYEFTHYNVALPLAGGATYPHHLGIKTHTQVWKDGSVKLNLMFNNGASGVDHSTDEDNPLGNVFVRSIELIYPKDLNIRAMFDDPGSDYQEVSPATFPASSGGIPAKSLSNYAKISILKVRSDQKFHLIPALQLFDRYFVMTEKVRDPSGTKAHNYSKLADQGFVIGGTNAQNEELWSWWTDRSKIPGRFGPQKYTFPDLSHFSQNPSASQNMIRQRHRQDLSRFEQAYRNNTKLSQIYLFQDDPLKKEGYQYMGATGGNGIESTPADAVRSAYGASREGILYLILRFFGNHHRQKFALYNRDGTAARVIDYEYEDNGVTYTGDNFFDWARPENGAPSCPGGLSPSESAKCQALTPYFPYTTYTPMNPDKFDFHLADQTQVRDIVWRGLQAPYSKESADFDPHDGQHLSRYIRHPTAIAYLTGFYPAIQALEMAAANAEHTMALNPSTKYSNPQGGGGSLFLKDQHVASLPGMGLVFGRGAGWHGYAATAYYSFANATYRTSIQPWYDKIVDVLSRGQVPCSGMIHVGKYDPGNHHVVGYRTSQRYEDNIADHFRLAIYRGVYRGTGSNNESKILNVINQHIAGMIRPYSWFEEENKPHAYLTIYPWPYTSGTPAYCYDPIVEWWTPSNLQAPLATYCTVGACPGINGRTNTFYLDNSIVMNWYTDSDTSQVRANFCKMQEMHGGFGTLKSHLEQSTPHDPPGGGYDHLGFSTMALRAFQEAERSGCSDFCSGSSQCGP